MSIKKEKIEVEFYECDRKSCGRKCQTMMLGISADYYINYLGKQYCSPHCLFKEYFNEVAFIQLNCNSCKRPIKYDVYLADGKYYCGNDCLLNKIFQNK